ncbi:ferredoxin [Mycolicibacterium thermoresistibile]|nr:ferredoxin [Mycolicibacterium thermoresistibile]
MRRGGGPAGRILTIIRGCTDGNREGKEVAMRVEVDRDRCEGNAICVGISPEIFELDDDDYAVVKLDPIPAELEQKALQAIDECPRAALNRRD